MADTTEPKIKSAAEFATLTPYEKGYAVYMLGAWPHEIHVPESFFPKHFDRAEYERGGWDAMIECQDAST